MIFGACVVKLEHDELVKIFIFRVLTLSHRDSIIVVNHYT